MSCELEEIRRDEVLHIAHRGFGLDCLASALTDMCGKGLRLTRAAECPGRPLGAWNFRWNFEGPARLRVSYDWRPKPYSSEP